MEYCFLLALAAMFDVCPNRLCKCLHYKCSWRMEVPLMEAKAVLFTKFANLDAFDLEVGLCLV
jgi:hypothetical protein